ncbi:MAG: hypothetical protein IJV92_07995 [Phascolarctobacterium sp.]|nr:hypothetical protein [Phascolarctobacterium sp.]
MATNGNPCIMADEHVIILPARRSCEYRLALERLEWSLKSIGGCSFYNTKDFDVTISP